MIKDNSKVRNISDEIKKLADLEDNMMPERIASLPPEQRDILKRYERAKKHILISRENISL